MTHAIAGQPETFLRSTNLLARFERLLEILGTANLLLMTLIVCVDVIGRDLFERPLPWGTELLEVVLAAMIFALYPVISLRENHITVDLIAVRPALRRVQRMLSALIGAALYLLIAVCTGRQAIRSAEYGDASPLLGIPTALVLAGMTVMATVTAVCFLISGVNAWRKIEPVYQPENALV